MDAGCELRNLLRIALHYSQKKNEVDPISTSNTNPGPYSLIHLHDMPMQGSGRV